MVKDLFKSALDLDTIFTPERFRVLLLIVVVVVLGLIAIRILVLLAGRLARRRLSPQYSMLIRKAIQYSGSVILLVVALRLAGAQITTLLGAAGIVGIAIGFASQTSMSNLISGLFLISEKPFQINDVIKMGDTMGIILSIDLLSVKIKTFDNQYIRIPNEKLLNSELTNITRFPIRRMDIRVSVAYRSDISQVRRVLEDIAASNPSCLDEPEPLILLTDFASSSMDFLFGVWFQKSDYLAVKNSIMQEIKERFDAEGIEIPFPHVSLYTGAATAPLPVQLRSGASWGALSSGGELKPRRAKPGSRRSGEIAQKRKARRA